LIASILLLIPTLPTIIHFPNASNNPFFFLPTFNHALVHFQCCIPGDPVYFSNAATNLFAFQRCQQIYRSSKDVNTVFSNIANKSIISSKDTNTVFSNVAFKIFGDMKIYSKE